MSVRIATVKKDSKSAWQRQIKRMLTAKELFRLLVSRYAFALLVLLSFNVIRPAALLAW
jgi:hypothetical protein